jgi:predicted methyltransferase
MKLIAALAAASSLLVLSGCTSGPYSNENSPKMAKQASALNMALEAQPDEVRARYNARHPAQTLAFFDVEPGMTVVEALPGGGWYTKILMPYLGEDGKIIGANYSDELYAKFGFGDEWTAKRVADSAKWVETATEWAGEDGPAVGTFQITKMPANLDGTADRVLFIRALHNLNRFNDMDGAASEAYRVLKPGGMVGVVQHRAPESAPAEWADGSKGYLKQSDVIAKFEAAGFRLKDTSDINANPKDVPGADDIVWRLPPSLNGTEEGTPERAAMEAIGESNRMTLLFMKPA